MTIEIAKEAFESWLTSRRGGFIGRANRLGETPLELFVRDTFNDEINFKYGVIPIQTHTTEMCVATSAGLQKIPLPVWAARFMHKCGAMVEVFNEGTMPTVRFQDCMLALERKAYEIPHVPSKEVENISGDIDSRAAQVAGLLRRALKTYRS